MSRRQWTGLAGLLFGATMITGIFVAGSTPDTDRKNPADLFAAYWNNSSHQDHAAISAVVLSFTAVLLISFAIGMAGLLRQRDDGPLPTLVAAGGATAAALLAAGSAVLNGVGVAAMDSHYQPDGNTAILFENTGYLIAAVGMMSAAAMAVAWSLSNRRARLIPQWTLVATVLVAIAGLGSFFTAWFLFMLMPAWSAIVGICLLTLRDSEPASAA